MAKNIEEIEGIGPAIGAKFTEAGVKTVDALLEQGASSSGRKKLAEATGLDASRILNFVNMADLFRIKGIGSEFSELLMAAGVDTVKELATRNPTNLHAAVEKVNAEKNLTRALPSESQIADFIDQAKNLPQVITH